MDHAACIGSSPLSKLTRRLAVIGLAVAACVSPLRAATPDQIEASIKKGVEHIYSLQTPSGNWEKSDSPPATITKGSGIDDGQWGGRTALATYALLAAGERPLDDRIVKSTEWLRQAQIQGIYAIGVRANVWLNLPSSAQNLGSMRADGLKLAQSVGAANTKFVGTYNYTAGKKLTRWDMSCSQYGVLGMWAVSQRLGDAVNPQYWLMVENAWHQLQQPDGGWTYQGQPKKEEDKTTIQLGAAGVATLFITQDYLHSNAGLEGTQGNINDPYINRGLAFISQKLPTFIKNPSSLYAMYGIERIGVASGYKYIGGIDWFQAGADALVKKQGKNGAWAGEPAADTAFALLFLSRGRAPVMMNKLQYDVDGKEGNWNQRPRDVANIAKWVDAKIERHLNWQIIDLKHEAVRDLHDSSICYISGNNALNFSDADKAVLKQYVQEGGLLVGNADATKAEFAKSFRDLGKALFPDYEFKQLDEKSPGPLMSGEQFPASQWKKKMRIEALGNNARYFMILLPDSDVSKTFQRNDANRAEAWQFFANLFLYSIDKTDARFKGDTHVVRADPKVKTTKTITVARLKYNGRWDPEPAGWVRLAAVMQNQDKVKLDVKTVELGKDSLDSFKVVHLTGVDKFTLTSAQRDALVAYVKKGGLLVVDACGGLDDFNGSAQAELSKMFPDQMAQLGTPIAKDNPLYTLNPPKDFAPKYRAYTLIKRPSGAANFRLNGIQFNGKLGVIYSPDDLSEGLVGQSVDGIIGYQPDVATQLMQRIIEMKNDSKI